MRHVAEVEPRRGLNPLQYLLGEAASPQVAEQRLRPAVG